MMKQRRFTKVGHVKQKCTGRSTTQFWFVVEPFDDLAAYGPQVVEVASDRVGGEAVRDEIGDERPELVEQSPAWRLVRLQSGPAGGPSFHEVGKGGWVRPADRSCVSGRHPIRIFEQRAYSSSTMDLKTILTRWHRDSSFVYGTSRLVGDSIHVEVQPRKGSKPVCSHCGFKDTIYDTAREPRGFEFVPLWGFTVVLLDWMRRVDCGRCGVVTERVPWADGKNRTCTV